MESHHFRHQGPHDIPAVACVIGIALLAWIQGHSEGAPRYGDRGACTGSMRPIIQCGDKIILGPASAIELGDVVVVPTRDTAIVTSYCKDGDCSEGLPPLGDQDPFFCHIPLFPVSVLHRVVAVHYYDGELYYETRGDNTIRSDSCYTPASLIHQKLVGIEHLLPPMDTTRYDWQYTLWRMRYDEYEQQLVEYQAGRLTYEALMLSYDIMAVSWGDFLVESQRLRFA